MTRPSSPLRVGVVGIGFGQAVLVPAFRTDPGCEVAAIVASSEERARRIADRLAIGTALGDWRRLISDPRVDAVAIAVPPSLQPAIAIAAANAGKHVFCEKPAALTVADARAMRDAAEGHVVHAIDFEFPELGAWRELKAALAAGRVGEITRVYVDMRVRRRRPEADERTSWKARDADGGAVWGGFLPHALYNLEWLAGPIGRVRARRPRADHAVHLWADYVSGASATVTIDTGVTFGSGHRVEVAGSTGMALLENPSTDHSGPFTLSIDRTIAYADPPRTESDGRVAAVAPIARRFLDAIRGNGRTAPDLGDAVRVQELMDAVDRAARDDTWVRV